MPVRVGMLGVGHVHAPSYVHCCKRSSDAEFVGHWDKDPRTSAAFEQHGSPLWQSLDDLLQASDAVVIAGENLDHATLIEAAAARSQSVLCEKPLAASAGELERIEKAVHTSGVLLMTAFPCPFSPAFASAVSKIDAGEIGRVLAVCATNHGKCPGGWFVEPDKSGGGAVIDHVVHVADLLHRVLREQPVSVHAFTGNNMNGQPWEDTAMLTLEYPGGAFATLDSSWSRSASYKTWGDVTLKILGEKAVIELDLFGQSLELFSDGTGSHGSLGFGSSLDQAMVEEFLRAHRESDSAKVTMEDGVRASRVALAAYESAKSGQPVSLSAKASSTR